MSITSTILKGRYLLVIDPDGTQHVTKIIEYKISPYQTILFTTLETFYIYPAVEITASKPFTMKVRSYLFTGHLLEGNKDYLEVLYG